MTKPLDSSYGHKINAILRLAVKLLEKKFIKDKETKDIINEAKKIVEEL